MDIKKIIDELERELSKLQMSRDEHVKMMQTFQQVRQKIEEDVNV